MTEPIPFTTTRYRCPYCPRTGSAKARITEHISRCWLNPEARGCKTCKHFEPYGPENADACKIGVDLTGRPQCGTCGGFGDVPGADLGMTECPDCAGDGEQIKPGPIVHCGTWEASGEWRWVRTADGGWHSGPPRDAADHQARLAEETS